MKAFLRFVVLALVSVLVVGLLGWWPTRRLAGDQGLIALACGCGISLAGSLLGALPLAIAGTAVERPQSDSPLARILGPTAIRLTVVLVAGVAAALSGWFSISPLLIWLAISYIVLLPVDTLFALSWLGKTG